MYVHLGNNVSVREQEIVGIFDLDNSSTSRITRDFLSAAEQEGMVITVSDELPKSIVLCCPEGSWQRVYISPLAAATIHKRMESGDID